MKKEARSLTIRTADGVETVLTVTDAQACKAFDEMIEGVRLLDARVKELEEAANEVAHAQWKNAAEQAAALANLCTVLERKPMVDFSISPAALSAERNRALKAEERATALERALVDLRGVAETVWASEDWRSDGEEAERLFQAIEQANIALGPREVTEDIVYGKWEGRATATRAVLTFIEEHIKKCEEVNRTGLLPYLIRMVAIRKLVLDSGELCKDGKNHGPWTTCAIDNKVGKRCARCGHKEHLSEG